MAFLSPLVLVAVWVCLPNSECPELEETTPLPTGEAHQKQGSMP